MKPIFRWTIGSVTQPGIDMLVTSISLMQGLYDCECWVCYNNLTDDQHSQINTIPGVSLLDQPIESLPIPPKGVAWKLYPPRLDINRHEVFIDNDIVIFKKMPKMDGFLQSDAVVYTKSLFHSFGTFKHLIPKDFRLNSGLFGIPPGFDFEKKILTNLIGRTSWLDSFDEQGLVALILGQHPKRIEIGLDEVQICHEGQFGSPKYGYHFVGANKGTLKAWNLFKKKTVLT